MSVCLPAALRMYVCKSVCTLFHSCTFAVNYNSSIQVWIVEKQIYTQALGVSCGEAAMHKLSTCTCVTKQLCSPLLVLPGRKLTTAAHQTPAADARRRPAPQTSFLVANDTVPSLLLVWDFCQRYG